jgi:hypothetical protein
LKYIGGFSGSSGGRGGFDPKTANDGVFTNAAAFNQKVKLLFLGIGSAEGSGTKTFGEQLTQAGIRTVCDSGPISSFPTSIPTNRSFVDTPLRNPDG